jgi:hypothetical protein
MIASGNDRCPSPGFVRAVVLLGAIAAGAPGRADAQAVCTWGGTADQPTGVVSFSPGLTVVPSTQPIAFTATGELAGGGCNDSEGNPRVMTFEGELLTGSSCAALRDWARVSGVPGVNFEETLGVLGGPVVGVLYGPGGVAGAFDAQVYTGGTGPDPCVSASGFEQTRFSGHVILTADGAGP